MKHQHLTSLFSLAAVLLGLASCSPPEDARVIRIGHAPNLTHVQALVARHMSRTGKGWFESKLPPHMKVEWRLYTGGPSAMEAIFGRAVELSYVGPSPAINAYSVSQGAELRFLSGAVNGGSALLVAPNFDASSIQNFKGSSIATPQLGNTQDVTCRAWLKSLRLTSTLEGGGDVRIAPSPSSMQAQLMIDGHIDAAWTVEPWVSIIEQKAKASVYLDEPNAVTTILVGRQAWLQAHPELAEVMRQAHQELTEWIIANPEEAKRMITEELTILTQSPQDAALIDEAWKRLTLTNDIDDKQLDDFIKAAQNLKLLGDTPHASEMMYSTPSTKKNKTQL